MAKVAVEIGTYTLKLFSKKKMYYDGEIEVAAAKDGTIAEIGLSRFDPLKEKALRPLGHGIKDVRLLGDILLFALSKYHLYSFLKRPALVLSVPTPLNTEDMKQLHEFLLENGIHRVESYPQIEMAAIGSGYDLDHPFYSCFMYIGMSNCTAALFYNGEMVFRSEYFLAGEQIDNAIYNWISRRYSLHVSDQTIEHIKRRLFSLEKAEKEEVMEVHGTDAGSGIYRTILLDSRQMQHLFDQIARRWVSWMGEFISRLEIQEQIDVFKRGIIGCGGMFCRKGLDAYLSKRLGCPVTSCVQPDKAVERGLRIKLDEI